MTTSHPTLHARIKSIPERTDVGRAGMDFYSVGHSDARHAAAELALPADACIEALRKMVEVHRNSASPRSRVDAWLAGRDALAAFDGEQA